MDSIFTVGSRKKWRPDKEAYGLGEVPMERGRYGSGLFRILSRRWLVFLVDVTEVLAIIVMKIMPV